MGSSKPRLRASCDGCFLAKVKCSKERPTCSRCLIVGLICKYSPSGITRSVARAAPDALCPATLSEESFAELSILNRSNSYAEHHQQHQHQHQHQQQRHLASAVPVSGGVGPASVVGAATPSPYASAVPGPLPPPPSAHVSGVYGSQAPSYTSASASASAHKSGAAPWFSANPYAGSSQSAGSLATTTALQPTSMYPQQHHSIPASSWSSAYNTTIMSPVEGGFYDLAAHWPQGDPSSGSSMDPYGAYHTGSYTTMNAYHTTVPGYDMSAGMSQYTAAEPRWQ